MQQLFRLLIFLIQPYMFWATNSPILRSTFWLCIQLLVHCCRPVPRLSWNWRQRGLSHAVAPELLEVLS